MVESTGLENRRACKRTVGSNPTLSANLMSHDSLLLCSSVEITLNYLPFFSAFCRSSVTSVCPNCISLAKAGELAAELLLRYNSTSLFASNVTYPQFITRRNFITQIRQESALSGESVEWAQ